MSTSIDKREKYAILRNYFAQTQINFETIKKISQFMTISDFVNNGIVYRENEQIKDILIVKTGEFKMSKRIVKKQSEELFLIRPKVHIFDICILQEGEAFGLEGYQENATPKHKYSVCCVTQIGQLYCLNLNLLHQLFQTSLVRFTLSDLLQTQNHIARNGVYKQRELKYQQLFQQQTYDNSNGIIKLKSQSQHTTQLDQLLTQQCTTTPKTSNLLKFRSITEQGSYYDKVDLIVKGNKSIIKNQHRFQLPNQDDDGMLARINRIKEEIYGSNNGTSQSPQHRDNSNVNENIAKIKIMHMMGFKPKINYMHFRSRQINYKKLIMPTQ